MRFLGTGIVILGLLLVVAAGCGFSHETGSSGRLEIGDVRPTLAGLPYRVNVHRVDPPEGDIAAFVGRAWGRHGAVLHFSVALGRQAVPVRGVGTRHAVWVPSLSFVYNDDSDVYNGTQTRAQWLEVGKMSAVIAQGLCVGASGEPCAT